MLTSRFEARSLLGPSVRGNLRVGSCAELRPIGAIRTRHKTGFHASGTALLGNPRRAVPVGFGDRVAVLLQVEADIRLRGDPGSVMRSYGRMRFLYLVERGAGRPAPLVPRYAGRSGEPWVDRDGRGLSLEVSGPFGRPVSLPEGGAFLVSLRYVYRFRERDADEAADIPLTIRTNWRFEARR